MPINLACPIWEKRSFPENIAATEQAAYFNALLATAGTKFPAYNTAAQAQCWRHIQHLIRHLIENPLTIANPLQDAAEHQCADFPLITACIAFARYKESPQTSADQLNLRLPDMPLPLGKDASDKEKKARSDALSARSDALASRAARSAEDPKRIFFRAFDAAEAFEQTAVAAVILLDCLVYQKILLADKEIIMLLRAAPVEIAAFILRATPELRKKQQLSKRIIIAAIQKKLTALKQQGLFASAAALIADTWQQYAEEFFTEIPLLARHLASIVKIYPELQPQLLSLIQPKQALALQNFFENALENEDYLPETDEESQFIEQLIQRANSSVTIVVDMNLPQPLPASAVLFELSLAGDAQQLSVIKKFIADYQAELARLKQQLYDFYELAVDFSVRHNKKQEAELQEKFHWLQQQIKHFSALAANNQNFATALPELHELNFMLTCFEQLMAYQPQLLEKPNFALWEKARDEYEVFCDYQQLVTYYPQQLIRQAAAAAKVPTLAENIKQFYEEFLLSLQNFEVKYAETSLLTEAAARLAQVKTVIHALSAIMNAQLGFLERAAETRAEQAAADVDQLLNEIDFFLFGTTGFLPQPLTAEQTTVVEFLLHCFAKRLLSGGETDTPTARAQIEEKIVILQLKIPAISLGELRDAFDALNFYLTTSAPTSDDTRVRPIATVITLPDFLQADHADIRKAAAAKTTKTDGPGQMTPIIRYDELIEQYQQLAKLMLLSSGAAIPAAQYQACLDHYSLLLKAFSSVTDRKAIVLLTEIKHKIDVLQKMSRGIINLELSPLEFSAALTLLNISPQSWPSYVNASLATATNDQNPLFNVQYLIEQCIQRQKKNPEKTMVLTHFPLVTLCIDCAIQGKSLTAAARISLYSMLKQPEGEEPPQPVMASVAGVLLKLFTDNVLAFEFPEVMTLLAIAPLPLARQSLAYIVKAKFLYPVSKEELLTGLQILCKTRRDICNDLTSLILADSRLTKHLSFDLLFDLYELANETIREKITIHCKLLFEENACLLIDKLQKTSTRLTAAELILSLSIGSVELMLQALVSGINISEQFITHLFERCRQEKDHVASEKLAHCLIVMLQQKIDQQLIINALRKDKPLFQTSFIQLLKPFIASHTSYKDSEHQPQLTCNFIDACQIFILAKLIDATENVTESRVYRVTSKCMMSLWSQLKGAQADTETETETETEMVVASTISEQTFLTEQLQEILTETTPDKDFTPLTSLCIKFPQIFFNSFPAGTDQKKIIAALDKIFKNPYALMRFFAAAQINLDFALYAKAFFACNLHHINRYKELPENFAHLFQQIMDHAEDLFKKTIVNQLPWQLWQEVEKRSNRLPLRYKINLINQLKQSAPGTRVFYYLIAKDGAQLIAYHEGKLALLKLFSPAEKTQYPLKDLLETLQQPHEKTTFYNLLLEQIKKQSETLLADILENNLSRLSKSVSAKIQQIVELLILLHQAIKPLQLNGADRDQLVFATETLTRLSRSKFFTTRVLSSETKQKIEAICTHQPSTLHAADDTQTTKKLIDLSCYYWQIEPSLLPQEISLEQQGAYCNAVFNHEKTKWPSYDLDSQTQCARSIQHIICGLIKRPQEFSFTDFPLLTQCILFVRKGEKNTADDKNNFLIGFRAADTFEQQLVASIILFSCLLDKTISLTTAEMVELLAIAHVDVAEFILRAEKQSFSPELIFAALKNKLTSKKESLLTESTKKIIFNLPKKYYSHLSNHPETLAEYTIAVVEKFPELQHELLQAIEAKALLRTSLAEKLKKFLNVEFNRLTFEPMIPDETGRSLSSNLKNTCIAVIRALKLIRLLSLSCEVKEDDITATPETTQLYPSLQLFLNKIAVVRKSYAALPAEQLSREAQTLRQELAAMGEKTIPCESLPAPRPAAELILELSALETTADQTNAIRKFLASYQAALCRIETEFYNFYDLSADYSITHDQKQENAVVEYFFWLKKQFYYCSSIVKFNEEFSLTLEAELTELQHQFLLFSNLCAEQSDFLHDFALRSWQGAQYINRLKKDDYRLRKHRLEFIMTAMTLAPEQNLEEKYQELLSDSKKIQSKHAKTQDAKEINTVAIHTQKIAAIVKTICLQINQPNFSDWLQSPNAIADLTTFCKKALETIFMTPACQAYSLNRQQKSAIHFLLRLYKETTSTINKAKIRGKDYSAIVVGLNKLKLNIAPADFEEFLIEFNEVIELLPHDQRYLGPTSFSCENSVPLLLIEEFSASDYYMSYNSKSPEAKLCQESFEHYHSSVALEQIQMLHDEAFMKAKKPQKYCTAKVNSQKLSQMILELKGYPFPHHKISSRLEKLRDRIKLFFIEHRQLSHFLFHYGALPLAIPEEQFKILFSALEFSPTKWLLYLDATLKIPAENYRAHQEVAHLNLQYLLEQAIQCQKENPRQIIIASIRSPLICLCLELCTLGQNAPAATKNAVLLLLQKHTETISKKAIACLLLKLFFSGQLSFEFSEVIQLLNPAGTETAVSYLPNILQAKFASPVTNDPAGKTALIRMLLDPEQAQALLTVFNTDPKFYDLFLNTIKIHVLTLLGDQLHIFDILSKEVKEKMCEIICALLKLHQLVITLTARQRNIEQLSFVNEQLRTVANSQFFPTMRLPQEIKEAMTELMRPEVTASLA